MTEWKFYDFDKNWDVFYKVWQTDEIQDILKKDMDNWCIYEYGTVVKPTWSKGEPLWHLARTDYHDTQIWKRIEERIKNERMVYYYKRTMDNIFPSKYKKMTLDQIKTEFYDICSEKIYEECSPKPHTIDSLVLVMGKNYISNALYACAEKLFPYNEVIFYNGNGTNGDSDEIYIREPKIVFDLLDFYYVSRGKLKIVLKPKYVNLDTESEISIEFSDEENNNTNTEDSNSGYHTDEEDSDCSE